MVRLGEIGQNCKAPSPPPKQIARWPPSGSNTLGPEDVKQNRVWWGSNPTADVLPRGESPVFFPLHGSAAVCHIATRRWGRSTPRLRQPTLSCSTCSCRLLSSPKFPQPVLGDILTPSCRWEALDRGSRCHNVDWNSQLG